MSNPNFIVELKERLMEAEAERDYYQSLVESFFTGEVPKHGASLQHFILAKHGKLRLKELTKQPSLLRSE